MQMNIDAKIVELEHSDETVMQLSNGCICCTLREDLVKAVRELAAQHRFDYLLIESTGISEPMPVAMTFAHRDEEGQSLSDIAKLDALVTVVDAERFVTNVIETDYLADLGLEASEDDERTVSDLLVEQVEFADILVINKSDLIDDRQLSQLKALLARLNPSAQVMVTQHGQVDPAALLNTHAFDLDEAASMAGWMQALNEPADFLKAGTSEAEEYGITSFVYRAQRPFHPERLLSRLEDDTVWKGVLRSKGFFWLASRHDVMGIWQSAGGAWKSEPSAFWQAALPDDEQERHEGWHPEWGDRCQELVWIGIDMDAQRLIAELDACLLSDAEMALGPVEWAQMPDPLPEWALVATA